MRRFLLAAILFAALTLPAAAGHIVAPEGYALSELSFSGYVGGFDVAPNGNFIILENQNLYEITPTGTVVRNLYTYDDFVYGSFVKIDSSSEKVYFGESSSGWIKSVNLDGTGAADIARVSLNYDFAMNNLGQRFAVSGSSVYLLTSSGVDEIARASGASGPLAFDSNGNLYYGTASSTWGATGGQAIVKWSASQVAGAVGSGYLTVTDGVKLVDDIDGPAGFAMDSAGLYYTSSVQYPGQVMLYAGGVTSEFATSDTEAGYSWLSTIRTNPTNGAVSVLVGTFTDNTISTLTPVPEPGSVVGLALGLGAFLVRRKKR